MTTLPSNHRTHRRRRRRVLPLRRGYSLAALFLLVATIAVLAGMASSLATSTNAAWEIAWPNLIVGLLGGAVLGGTIGINYERKMRATGIGVIVGATTGVAGGALSISDFNPYMAFMQSGILVCLAVIVRLTTSSRPKPRYVPLPPAEPPARTTFFTRVDRRRLLAAFFTAGCTLAGVAYLANSLRAANLSTPHGWSHAAGNLAIVLASSGLTGFLLWSALSRKTAEPEQVRTSPWE